MGLNGYKMRPNPGSAMASPGSAGHWFQLYLLSQYCKFPRNFPSIYILSIDIFPRRFSICKFLIWKILGRFPRSSKIVNWYVLKNIYRKKHSSEEFGTQFVFQISIPLKPLDAKHVLHIVMQVFLHYMDHTNIHENCLCSLSSKVTCQ